MPANEKKLEIVLEGENRTRGAFRGVERNLKGLKKMSGVATAAMAGGFAAASAAIIKSMQAAAQFEQRMSDLSTLISGDSTKAIGELHSGIVAMTRSIPRSADDLGAGAYKILSAGIEGTSNQLKVLEAAAKLGTAGLGTTEEAANLLSGAINAFGLDANNAEQIADVLFKTVKSGITNVSELQQSFGVAAATVVNAGVSLEDFQAATAALTTSTTTASVAQNSIRSAVSSLIAPGTKMVALYEKLGISSGENLIKTHGLVGAFKFLSDAVGGSNSALNELFGREEALAALIPLTTNRMEKFNQIQAEMTTGADALGEAFQKQTGTAISQYRLMTNALTETQIALGGFLNEAGSPIMRDFTLGLGVINDKLNEMTGSSSDLGEKIHAVTIFIGKWITGYLKVLKAIYIDTPKAIFAGVKRFTSNFKKAVSFGGGEKPNIKAPSFNTGKPILGLAEGGIVKSPTFAMVGESGPEAVVPLNKMGQMGGVTINVQGNLVGSEDEARRLGEIVVQQIKLNRRLSY